MVLRGYDGVNNGLTATVSLGTLGAGLTNEVWGFLPGGAGCCGVVAGDLTSYDYDDEYTGTPYQIPTTNCGYPQGCVSGGGPQWYAQTGSFTVTFTATVQGGTYDGQSVYSVFSDATNATGGFVGWEGIDPNGYSESPYDIHSGGITNDLANIYLGVPPPPGVPEPAEWALMLIGFGGLGAVIRRRRATAALA